MLQKIMQYAIPFNIDGSNKCGWNDLPKDLQHLIIWKYVCGTKPINKFKIVDEQSLLNVCEAGKDFQVLKEWEKALISTIEEFDERKMKEYNEVQSLYYGGYIVNVRYMNIFCDLKKMFLNKEFSTTLMSEDEECFLKMLPKIVKECCKFGMGRIVKNAIHTFLFDNRELLQTAADYCFECGDLSLVEWFHSKFDIIPSEESMEDAMLLGSVEVVKHCIKKYGFSIPMSVVMDSLKMNNTEPAKMALSLGNILSSDITFEKQYVYELFSYKSMKTIRWALENKYLTYQNIVDSFLHFHISNPLWISNAENILSLNAIATLCEIDKKSYNFIRCKEKREN